MLADGGWHRLMTGFPHCVTGPHNDQGQVAPWDPCIGSCHPSPTGTAHMAGRDHEIPRLPGAVCVPVWHHYCSKRQLMNQV